MGNLKNWVVTIDFTKMDMNILNYAKFFSKVCPPDKIYFVSIVQDSDSDRFFSDEYQVFRDQMVADQKLNLAHRVDQYFKDSKIRCEPVMLTGNPFEELISFSMRNSIDLVFAGRKEVSGGSGIVSENLSRNLPCAFLLVPEKSPLSLRNILVPTDFSDHSGLAMAVAQSFRQSDHEINLFAQHIYQIPKNLEKSDKSPEEIKRMLHIKADRKMQEWKSKDPFKSESILTLKGQESFPELVMREVRKHNVELIVMGSKGMTATDLAQLGSNTLRLMKSAGNIPLLIIKRENENVKLLKTLDFG